MHRAALLALLVTACDPATAVLLDGNALDDPATTDDTATEGTDVSSDTELDSDTETGTEVPPRVWTGQREFVFEQVGADCEDSLNETGIEITNDPQWQDARQACPSCNLIFLVDMDKSALCARRLFDGYPITTPALRGLAVSNGEVTIYAATLEVPIVWSVLAEADGGYSNLSYEYEGEASVLGFAIPYEVEGSASVR